MRLFLYEHISAGGLGPEAPESLRQEGLAMLRALAEDFGKIPGIHVVTLLDPSLADVLEGTQRHLTTPDLHDTLFRRLAQDAAATLVIAPEFDDILLHYTELVLEAGGRLLGPSPQAVRLAADKLALAHHLTERGIPTVPIAQVLTAFPNQESPTLEFDLPIVLKPRFGAGCVATYYVNRADHWDGVWAQACREWPGGEFLVQPRSPGLACSVTCVLSAAAGLALLPAQQHIGWSQSRMTYLGGRVPLFDSQEHLTQLRTLALQAARASGATGMVGVDLIQDGDQAFVIEINPRPTTSYVGLRALCRDNLAHIVWKMHRGEALEEPVWLPGAVRFDTRGNVTWERVQEPRTK